MHFWGASFLQFGFPGNGLGALGGACQGDARGISCGSTKRVLSHVTRHGAWDMQQWLTKFAWNKDCLSSHAGAFPEAG